MAFRFNELGYRNTRPTLDDSSDLGLANDRLFLFRGIPFFFASGNRSLELLQLRAPLPTKVKLPRKAERLLID